MEFKKRTNLNKKILILGSEGMLGHVVRRFFNEKGKYKIIKSNRKDFDVLKDDIQDLIKLHRPDFVINCIGILNKSREIESMKKVNSLFPHNLAKLSKDYGFKLIQISTDCVFNGIGGYPYSEESIPCPKDFYGISKAIGEVIDNHNLTIRTSIIGPEIKEKGMGLFKWVLDNKGNTVDGFSKVIWSGVTTLELAKGIKYFIEKGTTGLVNFTFGSISKKDLIDLINNIYCLDITVNDFQDIIENKILISNREEMKQYPKKSFKEMILELKEWY